ncbi:MAG: hypothetical protein JW776_05875 [Candidatus Lokiarchaeota archaeon]|nr:hypothetical protein [Candidatus Lokiarchaeota archaeon]
MSWEIEKLKFGKEITGQLFDAGMIRTWYRNRPQGWTLISGIWSPIYLNLRTLGSHPTILRRIGYALTRLIQEECLCNRVVGIATAGVPIATAISIQGGYPMGYTRKLEGVKTLVQLNQMISQYGQHSLVEGEFESGDAVALVDDLVTQLNSKLIARQQMITEAQRRKIDITCNTIIVLVDREQGAQQSAEEFGLSLHSLIPFQSRAMEWLKSKFTPLEYDVISHYFRDPEYFQDEGIQQDLTVRAISG